MSYIVSRIINGHKIKFFDGEILLSHQLDFSDPTVIDALKKAAVICPLIDDIEFGMHIMRDYGNPKWHLVNSGDLDTLANMLTKFESQTLIEPPSNLINFCRSAVQERERRVAQRILKAEREQRRKENSGGFVYLLRSEIGYFKIGRTIKPQDRMRTFSIKLPFNVEYEHVIQTDDMYALESQLHKHFASKRINGEWFDLTSEDVQYIKSLGGVA